MSNVLCTISFVLSDALSKELVRLNESLSKKFRTNFVSEFQTYRPHITIYQAEFPQKNVDDVLENIRKFARASSNISFSPSGLNIRGKYVAIAFKKSPEIEHFHKQLVKMLGGWNGQLAKRRALMDGGAA